MKSQLQILRDEIERLKSTDYPCDNSEQNVGFFNALDCVEAFLDSLPAQDLMWKRIKKDERLPCPAYVYSLAYERMSDCFKGRLVPNIPGVKVGTDTWYLPVADVKNLPKEEKE